VSMVNIELGVEVEIHMADFVFVSRSKLVFAVTV
jgi:hypothetical protein